jgi:predicted HicB family RNase H-like nuclease
MTKTEDHEDLRQLAEEIERAAEDIRQAAEDLYITFPDWIMFYREILGMRGLVHRKFETLKALAAFEQTDVYQDIQRMLADLRKRACEPSEDEPTKVITVRIPKSMHEALRNEAHEYKTTMNKLCISKLLQFIDTDYVPSDAEPPPEETKES